MSATCEITTTHATIKTSKSPPGDSLSALWAAVSDLACSPDWLWPKAAAKKQAAPKKPSPRAEEKASISSAPHPVVEATIESPLGPFELTESLLGSGGYARVVLGRNKTTGEPVAVKMLTCQAVNGCAASSEGAVIREVAALRRAGDHENICALRGYYRISSVEHAVVLEACCGGELFKLVEKHGAVDEGMVRPIFAGVIAGLHHLHARGIAHRDLKLENILMGGPGNDIPKIVDLGLAHTHAHGHDSEAAELTQFCGSRSYCAPEIMARRRYNGYRADIWSLAVCLFGLVSGFFPLDEASERDWRFQHVARLQQLQPVRSTTRAIYAFYGRTVPLTTHLIELLDAMLQIEPSRRVSLSAVSSSLWVCGAPEPVSAQTANAAAQGNVYVPVSEGLPDVVDTASPDHDGAADEVVIEVGPTLSTLGSLAAMDLDDRIDVEVTPPLQRGAGSEDEEELRARSEPPKIGRQRAYSRSVGVAA